MATRDFDREIRDENRLTHLEAEQKTTDDQLERIQKDIEQIKKDVSEVKTTFARVGGIILGFTMIGAFVGYILTQLDKLKHFLVGN
jgi:flagellar motor component MotA